MPTELPSSSPAPAASLQRRYGIGRALGAAALQMIAKLLVSAAKGCLALAERLNDRR